MKIKVERQRIKIIPEGEVDEAYIEEVLGLKEKGAVAQAERVDAMGLSCLAYIEITKAKK